MSEKSVDRLVTVENPQGLHARPAHALVQTANRFASKIEIEKDGESVDAKSILSILTLAAVQGTQLMLRATGADAEAAVQALGELFENGFGDDEPEEAV